MIIHRCALVIVAGIAACSEPPAPLAPPGDLTITHASVLDVRTGRVLPSRNVIIKDGVITAVTSDSARPPDGVRVLDAQGKLLTPGFIDAHLHLCNVYDPPCTSWFRGKLRLSTDAQAMAQHRQYLASLYLPYGVTAVRDAGTTERAMPLMLEWMRRSSDAPDYYPVGAHLILRDGNPRRPAPWQVFVADSADAAAKVREYHRLGIRNIKLYWRLREPGFQGALVEGQKLSMHVTGHVDYNIVTVDRALELGLRNFEHVLPWVLEGLTREDTARIWADVLRRTRIPDSTYAAPFYLAVPEQWNRVGPNNAQVLGLIDRLKAADASVTPTLHIFAQRYGLTWFTSPARDEFEDSSGWPPSDRARAVEGYRVMASYVKRAHDKGLRLNIGTDTDDPGKSVLSEMLLLHDAGIPMADVLRIATLDSARGIGQEAQYGSIEVGKRANLVLFDGDPLTRARDLLGGKTTIKDGVVYVP